MGLSNWLPFWMKPGILDGGTRESMLDHPQRIGPHLERQLQPQLNLDQLHCLALFRALSWKQTLCTAGQAQIVMTHPLYMLLTGAFFFA